MNRFSSQHQVQTLRIFFSIPQARIDRDLGGALLDVKRICEEIDAYCALAEQERTPELSARRYHNDLLQAHYMRKLPQICQEAALFFLAVVVEHIVNDVATCAVEKGEIRELMRQMTEIERREGLKKNEYWTIEESPPDYRQINAASEVLLNSISETIFLCVLRRYRFEAMADLYEKNRMEFDVMREVGRRRMYPGKSVELKVDESEAMFLFKKYGQAAVDLLRERSKKFNDRR
jgi:hypothetical protein